ncbi:glycosyltransferase [Phocaeicola coprophilus]|uniref:glycosyltransferase n=1 Tax=Phocaeicola coprophilus TaxID=387090 RepID=UPI00266BD4A1|nr:glycosyltransferase family 2 protein [Phocaeicola coprophilus]
MSNNISASIVTFHSPENEIKNLLNGLVNSAISTIYIIDNSLNDSLRSVQHISNKIIYIHNANLGYGAGHNIAINKALELKNKYHIVINPDIYLEGNSINILKEYMDNHPNVGLVMPQILYPNGKIQYLCKLLPTPMDLIIRRFIPISSYQEKSNYKYELRFTNYDKEMEVPALSGCFMFIRCSVLDKIGGFDERFFMYAEDLDLCRRIGEISQTIFYPNARVFHAYEKGSYKNKKLLKYHIISIIKYFNKWGWFFDKKRRKKNKEILNSLQNKIK